jgi:oligopeptide/dipeptide ABC transporter ATP-binding protein
MADLLRIENLEVKLHLREGDVNALHDVSMTVPAGKVLAVVGESGCGKSMTAKCLLGLLPQRAEITRGRMLLYPAKGGGAPVDLAILKPSGRDMRAIRGKRISMIFQEPMASFSPVHTIGEQIGEVVSLHEKLSKSEIRERVIEILRLVSIPMPERRMNSYPHELSGGLRQRAMIAMALACRPELVIADEPTTALDVTIQGQILNLLRDLQQKLGMAIMLITHDLGVVAQVADEVAVMYLGRVVEHNSVEGIFRNPRHPYTRGLLESIPKLGSGNVRRLTSIKGSVPSAFSKVAGCPFHLRCPYVIPGVCDRGAPPPEVGFADGGGVCCHLYMDGRQGIPEPESTLVEEPV